MRKELGGAPEGAVRRTGLIELAVALALIALNGVFALSELAVVSARRSKLTSLVERRRAGAAAALRLAEDPGRFLSTVQIGITLIGILAGAFSGAALGARLTDLLREGGVSQPVAEPLGYGVVISVITYLSVVVGELVPKQLALRDPERIACLVAPPMAIVSRIGLPAIWLLDASTKVIFRLLGSPDASDRGVTEDEIRSVVAEAESAGIIEGEERRMIAGVLRLGDRTVRGLLTPRTEVDSLDLSDPPEALRATLLSTAHSRLPVTDGDADDVVGVVHVRDLLAAMVSGEALDVRARMRTAPVVPDTLDALGVLAVLRDAAVPMALVHDEYGHFEGIVTPADTLGAITGAFRSDYDDPAVAAVRREDGSWLLEGAMPADEMRELLDLAMPTGRDYHTVAGFVIDALQHLPAVGESVTVDGWRFEIVDLDGLRVDKILASRTSASAGTRPAGLSPDETATASAAPTGVPVSFSGP